MKNILVFGDSHTKVFNYCNNRNNLFNFKVYEVPGATAQGMTNPNSKTDALNIFKDVLENENCDNYDYFMIMLGEVDCGFLHWIQEHKIERSIENLFKFVKNEVSKYFRSDKIIIVGSILPTIKDGCEGKFLNGARKDVKATREERTNLTLKYNSVLKNLSKLNNFKYYDITIYIFNNIDKYLTSNQYDHHLDDKKTYRFWLNSLTVLLNRGLI